MDDVQNVLVKTQQENLHWIPVNAQHNTEGNAWQKVLIYAYYRLLCCDWIK